MTQEIIEMAMEAEFVSRGKLSEEESELFVCTDKDIVRFANLVAAKAIAELESQEPVAWELGVVNGVVTRRPIAPPQRTWVGLTDEEISNLWSWSMTREAELTATTQQHAFARAIEAKLKERNT